MYSTLALTFVLAAGPGTISANRTYEALAVPTNPSDMESYRAVFEDAAEKLGDWSLIIAGVKVDAARLLRIATSAPGEPFSRVVREDMRCAIDVVDMALFLDDILAVAQQLRGSVVYVSAGRARKAGITIHPDDVFKQKPRRYGEGKAKSINIDKPKRQADLTPANDGDFLGPNWTTRFRNPGSLRSKMKALSASSPSGTYHTRIASLRRQLVEQGADWGLHSTVRRRERGYLMWGAFILSRSKTEAVLNQRVTKLRRYNGLWGLNIDIKWVHPDGWRATKEAAREMADAYDVVYATENGAKRSNHYDGVAVDITATALPRELRLSAPDGAQHTFDLSAPEETRDLNLTPRIIAWIEQHFLMAKLRSDYPHWNDKAPRRPKIKTPE